MPGILCLIGFALGMYGVYLIKHFQKIKGVIAILIAGVILNFAVGGSEDKPAEKNSNTKIEQSAKTDSNGEVNWESDLTQKGSLEKNMKLAMNKLKDMGNISSQTTPVKPDKLIENPEKYMGKIVECGGNILADENGGGNLENLYGDKAHIVISYSAEDNAAVMTTRKGSKNEENIGKFTVSSGMFIGVTEYPNDKGEMKKAAVIVGSPHVDSYATF